VLIVALVDAALLDVVEAADAEQVGQMSRPLTQFLHEHGVGIEGWIPQNEQAETGRADEQAEQEQSDNRLTRK
jgi:hypothetical protein